MDCSWKHKTRQHHVGAGFREPHRDKDVFREGACQLRVIRRAAWQGKIGGQDRRARKESRGGVLVHNKMGHVVMCSHPPDGWREVGGRRDGGQNVCLEGSFGGFPGTCRRQRAEGVACLAKRAGRARICEGSAVSPTAERWAPLHAAWECDVVWRGRLETRPNRDRCKMQRLVGW